MLKAEERIVQVRALQNQAGHAPPAQRRRYTDCNARILRIIDDYPNQQRMDYLRHIAYKFNTLRHRMNIQILLFVLQPRYMFMSR